jgi:translation elongation factor EF-4
VGFFSWWIFGYLDSDYVCSGIILLYDKYSGVYAKLVEACIAIIITSEIMAMLRRIDLQLEQPGMISGN